MMLINIWSTFYFYEIHINQETDLIFFVFPDTAPLKYFAE